METKTDTAFFKSLYFSRLIGEMEALDAETLYILETAAIVHDIGIRVSEEKEIW